MFFVDLPSYAGGPRVLPWIYTTDVPPENALSQTGEHFARPSVQVANEADLRQVEVVASTKPAGDTLVIRLRPDAMALHSQPFIDEVIDVAMRNGCTVELEGSLLSHAYYVLARSGVRLRTVDPFAPKERRQSFTKLVRDLIPLQIRSRGEVVRSYRASPDELARLLKTKAVEEALELLHTDGESAEVEELADVLEIVESLSAVHGYGIARVREFLNAKRKERGGFEEGAVLLETRAPPLTATLGRSRELFPDGEFDGGDVGGPSGREFRRALASGSRPTARGGRIEIPLVPPVLPTGARAVVALPAGQEAVVIYGEKSVRVEVRPQPERVPTGQQSFKL
jgi:predicted house-cleaning noncanonical NTP pyrophosphatase (MazG superfamily)